jgi:hypothetical protein
MDFIDLRTAIRDELGVDAYSCYRDERYSIPPSILDVLSNAAIVAFLTGFFGFDVLGKKAHNRIVRFWEKFRESPGLVDLSLNISPDVDRALQLCLTPDPQGTIKGRDNLVRLLVDYGMSEELAKAHAAIIEQSIATTLAARKASS